MPRLMALDVGEVRIGVALSDASGFLASPYTTVYVTPDESETRAAIQQLIEETEAQGLVIGLPVSLNGEIHGQAERIRAFAERLKTQVGLPVTFWDERFSTVEAERLLAQQGQHARIRRQGKRGKRGKKRVKHARQEIDALAAAVILQEYLDQNSARRAT
jgi:putative holliday junction resolvase